jgi:hypothetical protein
VERRLTKAPLQFLASARVPDENHGAGFQDSSVDPAEINPASIPLKSSQRRSR